MQRRKLEELNLLDNFLFGTMVSYPRIGERFLRILLKVIFRKNFERLTVVPQKVYYGSDTDRHGARLDVYLEGVAEDKGEAVYDVEPDQNGRARDVAALPKRVRFYHAKIDAQCLESGVGYEHLKQVVIVMITPYDPFGRDRMLYTIRNKCEEDPELPYDDGASTLFLYTRGRKGCPTRELGELLRYMEDTREENAVNETLKELHQMVCRVKQDREVSLEYMKVIEWERMLREEGRELGYEQGLEKGLERGLERGLEKGRREERERAEKELARIRKILEEKGIIV